jgi:hypothetical protein
LRFDQGPMNFILVAEFVCDATSDDLRLPHGRVYARKRKCPSAPYCAIFAALRAWLTWPAALDTGTSRELPGAHVASLLDLAAMLHVVLTHLGREPEWGYDFAVLDVRADCYVR